MYKLSFYRDSNGYSDVEEYIKELQKETSKDGRIKAKKVSTYFRYIKENGQRAKEPHVKKITKDLWELRPLRDRFMYAFIKDNYIVVLTHFIKSTQETPKREIERANKRLKDFIERGDWNG